MSTLATHVVPKTAARTIVAEPDEAPEPNKAPEFFGVEPGGILVWTNRSEEYPTFEIVFEGDSPASPGDILIGIGSIVIHVTKEGEFKYRTRHISKRGETKDSPRRFLRSCIGC